MKVRRGFVSNSSSSSFVAVGYVFDGKDELVSAMGGIDAIREMCKGKVFKYTMFDTIEEASDESIIMDIDDIIYELTDEMPYINDCDIIYVGVEVTVHGTPDEFVQHIRNAEEKVNDTIRPLLKEVEQEPSCIEEIIIDR